MSRKALIFIILVVCILFIVAGSLPSLLPPSSRNPSVDIRTLVINDGDLPFGWVIKGSPDEYPPHSDLDWGERNWVVRFRAVGFQGFVEHSVFEFRNKIAAVYGEYKIINQGYLFNNSKRSDAKTLSYESPFSNSWKINCWEGNNDIRACNIIARYDEYVTFFLITAPQSEIREKDIENILFKIDNLMATMLGKKY